MSGPSEKYISSPRSAGELSSPSPLLPIYVENHSTSVHEGTTLFRGTIKTTKKYKVGCCTHLLQIVANVFYCIFQSVAVPFILFAQSLLEPSGGFIWPIAILVSVLMVFTWQFPSCGKFHWSFYSGGTDLQWNCSFKRDSFTKHSFRSMFELMALELILLPFLHIFGILIIMIFFPEISAQDALFTWKSLLGGLFEASIIGILVSINKTIRYLKNKK